MFKVIATRRLHATPARLPRGFTALTCAFALTVMLTGTAAARTPEGDPGVRETVHHWLPGIATKEWVNAKLHTTTGNRILVFQ